MLVHAILHKDFTLSTHVSGLRTASVKSDKKRSAEGLWKGLCVRACRQNYILGLDWSVYEMAGVHI
jgi:hypothetical protein